MVLYLFYLMHAFILHTLWADAVPHENGILPYPSLKQHAFMLCMQARELAEEAGLSEQGLAHVLRIVGTCSVDPETGSARAHR